MSKRSSITHSALVQRLVESGQEFALFRYPRDPDPRLVMGAARPLEALPGASPHGHLPSGFLFHPFAPTLSCPTLLIAPEVVCRGWELIALETEALEHRRVALCQLERKLQRAVPHGSDFQRIYRKFRNQIDRGRARSLFLSQAIEGSWAEAADEGELFLKMAELYPDEMTYMVYTRTSGRWTGHTPRTLLRGSSRRVETVSPSGTRHIAYAPNLGQMVSDLLEIPSEEVSGVPSGMAREFIRLHEGYPRLYFTGLLGPLNIFDETAIFLNLSCLKQHPGGRAVFYGGTTLR